MKRLTGATIILALCLLIDGAADVLYAADLVTRDMHHGWDVTVTVAFVAWVFCLLWNGED